MTVFRPLVVAWLLLLVGTAGCTVLEITAPASPAPATASPPTVTHHPSPAPSPSATPTRLPPVPLGQLITFDDFEAGGEWETVEGPAGAASIADGRLVLSVHKPSTSLLQSAPYPPAGDFFVQVDVRSEVCSPGDEFGMAIRLSPSGEHYRVSLLCDGAARLLRVLTDQTHALTPVLRTGAVIPGPGSLNRLAVSAEGPLLRVFVNNQVVFEDRDSRLPFGRLGFFVRPGRSGQTTIAFDGLAVYALPGTPAPPP